jgi:hypothetical protein
MAGENAQRRRAAVPAKILQAAMIVVVCSAIVGAAAQATVSGSTDDELKDFDADRDEAELAAEFEESVLGALAEFADIEGESLTDVLNRRNNLGVTGGGTLYSGIERSLDHGALPAGSGSTLAGPCQGLAMSFGPEGELLAAAADFDDRSPPIDLLASDLDGGDLTQAFTRSNPFIVDANGFVAWAGGSELAPRNHRFQVRTQSFTLVRGGHHNDGEHRLSSGTFDLAEEIPESAKINALLRIDGSIDADDGFSCVGDGYFRIRGGRPILDVAGIGLMALASIGLLFTARPTTLPEVAAAPIEVGS